MTTTEEAMMTDHTEMQIPDDIARAATKAYDAPLNDDGASLVGIVNRMAEDYVKLAIARAILAERERCARIAISHIPLPFKDLADAPLQELATRIASKIRSVDK